MNYAQMSMAISDWLNKDNIDKVLPTIIRFGQRDLEDNLRIRAMEYHPATADLNAGTASLALPSDYLEMIYMQFIKGNVRYPLEIRLSPRDHYATFQAATSTGVPQVLTRIGDDLHFDVLTDVLYTRDWAYYRRLTVLSATAPNNTNWWSENAEEAFLMSCLDKASLYITGVQDSDRKKWAEARALNIERLRHREARETTGGNVLRSAPFTL